MKYTSKQVHIFMHKLTKHIFTIEHHIHTHTPIHKHKYKVINKHKPSFLGVWLRFETPGLHYTTLLLHYKYIRTRTHIPYTHMSYTHHTKIIELMQNYEN